MTNFNKRLFQRNDGKNLILYGRNIHQEDASQELGIIPSSEPHMRWHPARQEWVSYYTSREKRTFFTHKEYCTIFNVENLNYKNEIKFKDF